MEGYVFNTSLLSEQEQDDILMALQSVATATIPQVEEVLNKLSRLFKKDMGKPKQPETAIHSYTQRNNHKPCYKVPLL
ncbi:hypothetical protein GMA19_00665 [Paenibacillus polymyxa E681]|nr:hypothetical protein GE561_00666 [Paenibacillus polymyxa E681]QNV60352.1 hypothetical protein GMA19_00665 [Paenibacillus polymyxa E681]